MKIKIIYNVKDEPVEGKYQYSEGLSEIKGGSFFIETDFGQIEFISEKEGELQEFVNDLGKIQKELSNSGAP